MALALSDKGVPTRKQLQTWYGAERIISVRDDAGDKSQRTEGQMDFFFACYIVTLYPAGAEGLNELLSHLMV